MPTYEYECSNCGHHLEELQSFTEPPMVRCPQCKTDSLMRVMSGGSGLIFKGSGFYQTDYRKGHGSSADGKEKTAKEDGATTEKKEGEKKESPKERQGGKTEREDGAKTEKKEGEKKESPKKRQGGKPEGGPPSGDKV